MELSDPWTEMGIEIGLPKGRVQVITRQLHRRFGSVPAALTESLLHLNATQLDDFGEALLGFATLTDAQSWISRL